MGRILGSVTHCVCPVLGSFGSLGLSTWLLLFGCFQFWSESFLLLLHGPLLTSLMGSPFSSHCLHPSFCAAGPRRGDVLRQATWIEAGCPCTWGELGALSLAAKLPPKCLSQAALGLRGGFPYCLPNDACVIPSPTARVDLHSSGHRVGTEGGGSGVCGGVVEETHEDSH